MIPHARGERKHILENYIQNVKSLCQPVDSARRVFQPRDRENPPIRHVFPILLVNFARRVFPKAEGSCASPVYSLPIPPETEEKSLKELRGNWVNSFYVFAEAPTLLSRI